VKITATKQLGITTKQIRKCTHIVNILARLFAFVELPEKLHN